MLWSSFVVRICDVCVWFSGSEGGCVGKKKDVDRFVDGSGLEGGTKKAIFLYKSSRPFYRES